MGYKVEDYWPIRQLKVLARLPIQCDTWLGYGHTISSDESNSPYAKNTKLCSIMLLGGLNNNFEAMNLKLNKKEKINFCQLFPLYEEELIFKQKNGSDALLDLFDDNDIMPIINCKRKNYGKKKK